MLFADFGATAMPIHDWTRVSAGTFHDFHGASVIHLKESLNAGLLPKGYYAQSEQHTGRAIADILTLNTEDSGRHGTEGPPSDGGTAVLESPPRVGRKLVASPNAAYRAARRTVAVRHTSDHRVVALIEILSPANKDRPASVRAFVEKVHSVLDHGCHLLMVDLHPPGPHDPQGTHGAIWEAFDPQDYLLPRDKPFTLASYVAQPLPEAYVVHLAVGDPLPAWPLFLETDLSVDVPLAPTYEQAYRGVPEFWREVVEGRRAV